MRFKLPFSLTGAADHPRWRSCLQDRIFKYIHLTNMDTITSATTLDPKFFKKLFPAEWKAAETDEDGEEVDDPLSNPEHPELLTSCLVHALSTGNGFNSWLYDVFTGIRDSLSDDLAEKTAGVAPGDLVALLKGINLAIGHLETHDPYDLEALYQKSTMAGEGGQDLMKYLALLRTYQRRLTAANAPMADLKCQKILLRGLDQDVFSSFIDNADRNAY
jgi:hypothetical protein